MKRYWLACLTRLLDWVSLTRVLDWLTRTNVQPCNLAPILHWRTQFRSHILGRSWRIVLSSRTGSPQISDQTKSWSWYRRHIFLLWHGDPSISFLWIPGCFLIFFDELVCSSCWGFAGCSLHQTADSYHLFHWCRSLCITKLKICSTHGSWVSTVYELLISQLIIHPK